VVSFFSEEITFAIPLDRLRAVSNDSVSRGAISDLMENLSTTTSIVLFFFASTVGRSSISYTTPLIRKRTKPLDLILLILNVLLSCQSPMERAEEIYYPVLIA